MRRMICPTSSTYNPSTLAMCQPPPPILQSDLHCCLQWDGLWRVEQCWVRWRRSLRRARSSSRMTTCSPSTGSPSCLPTLPSVMRRGRTVNWTRAFISRAKLDQIEPSRYKIIDMVWRQTIDTSICRLQLPYQLVSLGPPSWQLGTGGHNQLQLGVSWWTDWTLTDQVILLLPFR